MNSGNRYQWQTPYRSTEENEDVVTNMAIAISAEYLYEQCDTEAKSQGIQEEQTPSLSWFRFQL